MGIFLIAGFFMVSLAIAIFMAISTYQHYARTTLDNIDAYNALLSGKHIRKSGVKIYQTPQPEISTRPMVKNDKFSVISASHIISGNSNAKKAPVLMASYTNIPANLPIAA